MLSKRSLDDTSAQPGPARKRLPAIDAARGLALVGMMIVNVGPVIHENPLHWLWFAPQGRASILFVLVAGLSVAMFLRGRSRAEGQAVLLWRVAILFTGGLLLSTLPHGVNVILPLYATLFLIAPVIARLKSSVLGCISLVLTAVGPLAFLLASPDIRADVPLLWNGNLQQFAHSLFLSGPYPFVVWLVPFVVGIMLMRTDLRSPRNHLHFIWVGGFATVACFLLAEVFGRVVGPEPQGFGLLLTGVAHSQMPLWLVGATASAILTLGVLLHYWEALDRYLWPVAVLGRMPLTFYAAHLLVLAVINPVWQYGFAGGVVLSAVIIGVFLLAAVLMDRTLGAGPLERLLRGRWITARIKSRRPAF